ANIGESDSDKRCHKGGAGEHKRENNCGPRRCFEFSPVTALIDSCNVLISEDRLPHYLTCRDHFFHGGFKVPLPDLFPQVRAWFGSSSGRGLNNCILDVSSARNVSFGQLLKIDVLCQGCLSRMDLQLPNLGPFFRAWHLKKYMCADTPLECRVEICR